jgi:hypothetical protein
MDSTGFGTEPVNREKVKYVMGEYKKGNLHAGPGGKHKAKGFKQAIAIALSEGRKWAGKEWNG